MMIEVIYDDSVQTVNIEQKDYILTVCQMKYVLRQCFLRQQMVDYFTHTLSPYVVYVIYKLECWKEETCV